MTSTLTPTAETWSDVQARLDAATAADYAAVRQELEDAEAEHRRLTAAAILGDFETVGPLDLQRCESRKQLAEMRLKGLPDKHRRATNEASRAHAATVRAQAEAFLARHKSADSRVEAARKRVAAAVRELGEVADAYNGDVAALLAEVRPAFTESVRTEPLVEMEPYRDDSTGQVHTRPVVKQPAGPIFSTPVGGEIDGMHVQWDGVVNGRAGTPTALTVDGTVIEPMAIDKLVLAEVEQALPAALREPVGRLLRPFGRLGSAA